MSSSDMTMVRVYLSEQEAGIDKVAHWLKEESGVMGFTLFRGIAGLGGDGYVHTSSLLALSSDLPIVVEFFDKPEKISQIMAQLHLHVKPDHIVSWPVKAGI
jgi:PII-like signaling protein